MTAKKNYKAMSFGELLVEGLTEAAAIACGEKKPVKVTRIRVTAREAEVRPSWRGRDVLDHEGDASGPW